MKIDRRITNGLAWAGAALVIAIPAADAALRQFGPSDTPQMAVVEEQAAPAPVVVPETAETPKAAPTAVKKPVAESQAVPGPTAKPAPIATASAAGGAVDSFLQSGRDLPSYISDGGQTERTQTAALAPVEEVVIKPVATPEPEPVAALPTKTVTFPTPVSQRPAAVPRSAVVPQQPPLVIDQPNVVVTAEDLEDWESGPLSDFLARRQAEPAPSDYDPDGFFLDEGPNSSARVNRFPRAYGYDDYAFE